MKDYGATVNIAISAFTIVICLVKFLGDVQSLKIVKKERRYFVRLLLYESVMLVAVFLANLFYFTIKNTELQIFLTDCAYAICYVFYYLLIVVFVYYSIEYISKIIDEDIRPARYTIPVALISMAIWVISAFNGMIVEYSIEGFSLGPLYVLGQVGGYLLILEPFYYLAKYRKKITIKYVVILSSFIIFPLIGVVLRNFFQDIVFMPFMIFLSIVLIENTIQYDRELLYIEQEKRLARTRIQILLNQIKPHFLYNVLNSIYVLCEKDPEMAQEAIGNFSEYLRANLKFIEQEESVAFGKEMEVVRYYLELEKIRFGDKLKVEYNDTFRGFKLPALSVQILVENAVKHGLHKKEEGGTVKISSYLDNDTAVVEVKDDGVGFDTDIGIDESSHLGLKTLQERLKIMSEGTLTVESKVGQGTIAVIRIPYIKNGIQVGET
jgi:sensor histidine kinase YesM